MTTTNEIGLFSKAWGKGQPAGYHDWTLSSRDWASAARIYPILSHDMATIDADVIIAGLMHFSQRGDPAAARIGAPPVKHRGS